MAAPAATAEAAEVGREEAQEQLDAVLSELNNLDSWLSEAQRRRAEWLKEVRSNDQAVAEANASVKAREGALAQAQETIKELRARQKRLDHRRADGVRRLAAHLAVAYRFTGKEFVQLLFSQESAERAERMVVYQNFITQARIDSIIALRQLAAEAERSENSLLQQQEVERQEMDSLVAQRERLADERERRRMLLTNLNEELESKESRRTRLLGDRKRLQALLALFERRSAPGGDFAARKGSLPWPLQGELSGKFGQQRRDSGMTWKGVLLRAAQGSPVIAVHGGRVVFSDWLLGFGYLAIIDHGGGYMTLYGHADELTKQVDELVEPGEVIALAGSSGGSNDSGVYFELRFKGQSQDPLGWLGK